MRKLRWLALALAVMVAPAALVFVSDMYFLGFSEDEGRKDVLVHEIGLSSLRSDFDGAIWPAFGSERARVIPDISLKIEPEAPNLWKKSFECGTRAIKVELAETDELSETNRRFAASEIEESQRGIRYRQWIHPFSNRAKARAFSNLELAAINACFKATPLHDTCSDYWFDGRVRVEDVAELLVEQGVMDVTEDGYCWGWSIIEIAE